MSQDLVIEAVGVRKRYGGVVALDGVDFRARRGLTALVGPNGAGKTTLIEGLLGLRKLDEGRVWVLGEEVRGELPPGLARKIGVVLERMSLLDMLTAVENLQLVAELSGIRITRRDIFHALELVGAGDLAKRLYGDLSTGQRRKVDIAATLLGNPELVILDEPEAGLDPAARVELIELLGKLAKGGLAVLFSTHDLALAAKAWEISVIIRGKVAASGRPEEVAQRYGGRWRVHYRLRHGEERVVELSDVGELPAALRDLHNVVSVEVKPPDLFEAFRKLAHD
ncbi:ABC-type multidrug transport system, ATPase component [Pyrobaculum oguniense TE7]|uniref:ABC-type multidrug transport system, ATPase component n=1 Tax=Pyrobaculum oguniense (strain DSM 13380 / JCM 10595 / TE7) TaxID=698757 RepID=H6QDU2_PYROT|nr:ABC-type multidrug transport system, ATPase component [Pyrobaculum oguniense TE7]